MKTRSRATTSSLFLIELILAILFFSITSAICVQFFVKSHLLTKQSQELTLGANECAAVAEICKTSEDAQVALARIHSVYPLGEVNGEQIDIFYNSDLQACGKTSPAYILNVTTSTEDHLFQVKMEMKNAEGQSIYQLNTTYHIGRRTPYAER